MNTPSALRAPARRLAPLGAAGAALLLSLLSCGREITGPAGGLRIADGLSFLAQFPGEFASVEQGAGTVVPYSKVRVLFTRGNGEVALARVLPISSEVAQFEASLSVPLSADAPATGEELDLTLQYINAAGDTVFRGGPASVLARVLRRGESAPEPTPISLTYTGPGSSATSVTLAPDTIALEAGAPFAFTATARDGQGNVVTDAPILYSTLDPTKATVTSSNAGDGITLATRGEARVRVALAAGGAADTALLLIAPKPSSLGFVGGATLSGVAGAILPDSIGVRLLATDGLPIAGAEVSVAIIGGGTTNDSTLVTDANGRAAVQWTLGSLVGSGAQALSFSAPGVNSVTVVVNVSGSVLQARTLLISEQPTSGVALQPFGQITVQARDSTGAVATNYNASVTANFIEVPSGATVTGSVGIFAVNGFATFNGLTPNKVGTYRFTVSGVGVAPDTSLAIVVGPGSPTVVTQQSGAEQSANVNTALTAPIVVRVADAADNPVPNIVVNFAVATGGGTLTGAVDTTDANGLVTLGSWTLGATAGPQTITATVVGAPPLTITALAIAQAPIITLGVVGSNVIGFGRSGQLSVRLGQPAPAGGLVVSVQSDSTQLLTIAAPGTVSIAVGDTLGTIDVNGVAVGTARVRAGAAGWEGDTLNVPVTLNLISLPTTLNVPLGQSVSLPVQLADVAPAGGVDVDVSTASAAVASVAPSIASIPAGSATANVNVTGNALGTTTITATNPNYAQDVVTVNVTAAVDIIASSVTLNESFGTAVNVRIASGGAAVPAPPGGVLLNFVSGDPLCASVPATATIAAGNSTVSVPITAGTGTVFPCSTRITASGPAGYATDSVTASVGAQPGITVTSSPIGSGLQRLSSFTLGTSIHGGTTVRVTSSNPAKLLIAPNASATGTDFVDVPVAFNGISGNYVMQAVEGILNDTVSVIVTAPGFITRTQVLRIYQPVFFIANLLTSRTTTQGDNNFDIRIGSPPDSISNSLSSFDAIRVGGVPLTFSVVNDSLPFGDLVTTATVGDSVTVTIPVGASGTPSSVSLGGVAFRSQAAGVAFVRAFNSAVRPGGTTSATITTTPSSIAALVGFSAPIGRGLQRSGVAVQLSNPVVGEPVPVTVRASRPGFVLLSTSATVVGIPDSLVLSIPAGQSSVSFALQVPENAALDTLSLIATAPGYTERRADIQILEPIVRVSGLNTTGTTATADDIFQAEVGSPSSAVATTINSFDPVRTGSPGFPVTFVSDSALVGRLVTSAGVVDSVDINVVELTRLTPTNLAAGGVAFRYLGGGTGVVRVQSPRAREVPASTATVTVTQPSIVALSGFGMGAGLARSSTITLDAPAPAGGLPVTLTASKPDRLLFAPNSSSLGTSTLEVIVPQGAFSAQVIIQALDVLPDTVVITASSPGWTSRNANIFIWPAVIQVSSLLGSTTSLAADDPFVVLIGSPSAATGTTISATNPRYFGAPPLPVTFRSSDGLVARFVTSLGESDSAVVNILPGANQTPATVATGGIALRTLTTGTSVISATAPGTTQGSTAVGSTVVVNAPSITVPTSQPQVGAGLQVSGSTISLNAAQHGGVDVVIRSSNPAVLKLARNTAELAADSIIVFVPNGSASVSYLLVGMEGQTGSVQIIARATGFVDGSATITVVPPAVDISGMTPTATAGGSDDSFTVRVGVPNSTFSSISTQSVRFGSSGITVTVASSNAAVATLVSTLQTTTPQSIVIPAGTASGPGTVALGGLALRPLAAGTTNVSASAAGFANVTTGTITVTVNAP